MKSGPKHNPHKPIGTAEYMAALTRLAGGRIRCTACETGKPCRWCNPVVTEGERMVNLPAGGKE